MRLTDTSVWQQHTGPDADVVVSSRVRLARNIVGFPFVSRSSPPQRHEVVRVVQQASWPEPLNKSLVWVNLQQATTLDGDHDLLERNAALHDQLAVLVGVPPERLHAASVA